MNQISTSESQVPMMPSAHLPTSNRRLLAARLKQQHYGRLEIKLIGSLRVRRGEVILGYRELGGPKPRQILEILLLSLGSPVSKDRLIEILWDGQAPPEALPTLESYVSVLRRHLQPGMGKDGPLRTVSRGYMVDRELVDLDLDQFDVLLRRAEAAVPHQALDLLGQALAMASAPLLEDELLASWAEDERSRHAARVFHARTLAAEAALSQGQAEMAVTWARQALAYDALSERAWSALVLGLETCGQPIEALRAFEQCRRTLDSEMGCRPGTALQSAHARLLKATSGAPAPMPSLSALPGTADFSAVLGPIIRILTINRHRTFTELLSAALSREPDLLSIGAAASVATGLKMVQDLAPDVVVMDLYLPDGEGLAAAKRILDVAPRTRVVVLAWDPTPDALRLAAAIGVCVFLPNAGSLATMLDVLRRGKPEHAAMPAMGAGPERPWERTRTVAPEPGLTARELEVLKLLAEGHELRAAAARLNVSLKTVSHHVNAIFHKLRNQQAESGAAVPRRGLRPQTADT
jgi:SARP family transcriptional regulator, regulator of embCAB operon